ncbi:hypothetical protein [Streptomyces sp. NPDC048644]|uniref:hypothetical protein n=1 Tax=Streptomyces sp. NPDC048644 TaxID=3365582 RepID=UPI0037110862
MRRVALTLAAGVVVGGLLTGCSGGDEAGKDGAAKPSASVSASAKSDGAGGKKSSAAGDVKIVKSGVEDHKVWGTGAYVVHYEITNHGSEVADYFAQLEFLDKDGDVLGSTGITADKLGAGKSKKGDIAPVEAEIENGKPADIKSVRVSQVDRT